MKKEITQDRLTKAITEFTALETGSRHPKLIKLAAAYRRAGFDEEAATEAIYGLYAKTWPDSPPAPREVENTIQKAYSEDSVFVGATTHRVASLPPPQIVEVGRWIDAHPFDMTPVDKLADWRQGVQELMETVSDERYATHQAVQLHALFRSNDTVYAGPVDGGKTALCYAAVSEWFSTDERRGMLAKANYITVNPLSRPSRSDADVTTYCNLLVEYDKPFDGSSEDALSPMSLDELGNHPDDPRLKQLLLLDYLIDAGLPVATVTYSGGKSFHAVLKLANIRNKEEWDQKVKGLIYPLLSVMGADRANCNPARLTRLAGALRGDIPQELVYADRGCKAKDPEEVAGILKGFLDEAGATYTNKAVAAPVQMCLDLVNTYLTENKIVVRTNGMTGRMEITGGPDHISRAKANTVYSCLISDMVGYFQTMFPRVNRTTLESYLDTIAGFNEYHPVAEKLASTEWDGVDRLSMAIDALVGLEPATRPLVRKWFMQTVALAFNEDGALPATGVLTLVGPQGCGKTSYFRRLCPSNDRYFKEGVTIDMERKDTVIAALSGWIAELGELESVTRKEQANLKSFITAQRDVFRLPYAREACDRPRRTSFCATTNSSDVLTDPTGNRRWWIVHITAVDYTLLDKVAASEDSLWQLWAQVTHEWKAAGRLAYLPTAEETAIIAAASEDSRQLVKHEQLIMDYYDWSSPGREWRSTTSIALQLGLTMDKVTELGRTLSVLANRGLIEKRKRGSAGYIVPCKKQSPAIPL